MVSWAFPLLLLAGTAQAQQGAVPIVIYQGDDPGLAAARVYAAGELGDSGLEVGQLNPITFAEAMTGQQPVLLGQGAVSACGGAPQDMQALREAVGRAESGVSYMEFDQAISHLYTANTVLSCLDEPVHPDVAARLFFLQGIVFQAKANEPRARAAFQQALAFEPGLVWDDYMAPDARPLFQQAVEQEKEKDTVRVRLVPTPESGTFWVDGALVLENDGVVSLSVGDHVLQVVGSQPETVRVRLEAVDAESEESEAGGEDGAGVQVSAEPTEQQQEVLTLLVPGAISSEHLGWVLDADKQTDLAMVFSAVLREGEIVYLSVGSEVYRGTVGGGGWESLDLPARFGLSDGMGSRRITSQVLMWSGGGAAALSGLLVGVNYLRVMEYVRAGSAGTVTFDSYEQNKTLYEGGVSRMKVGTIVGTVGLTMAATGYLVRPKSTGVSLVPFVAPGMAGAWLEVR